MMPSLPFACLLSAAVLSASFAGKRTFAVGLALAVGWVSFNAAWWDYSPAALLHMSPTDIWAVTDMLVGAAVLYFGRYNWWAFAIWAMLTVQMVLYCFYQFSALEFAVLSAALDALFIGQVAALFMAGGPTCVHHLLDCFRRARDALRPTVAASRQTGTQA